MKIKTKTIGQMEHKSITLIGHKTTMIIGEQKTVHMEISRFGPVTGKPTDVNKITLEEQLIENHLSARKS